MLPTVDFLGSPTDTYALYVMLSFIIVFIGVLALKPRQFPLRYVLGGVIIFIFFAFIGAVLFNILLHGSSEMSVVNMLYHAGIAYLGAPILGFFALWVYCKGIKIPFLAVADYVAPFVILQLFIARFGCLAYGCCYGIPSSLPWAYTFRSWGIASIVPRHPTQAYAIAYTFAILISSCYFYRKTKNVRKIPSPEGWEKRSLEERKQLIREAPSAGIVFFYVFLCYGFLRFFNEFLRAEGPFIYGPIKISHIILFIFVVVSIIGLRLIIKNSSAKEEILRALKGAVIRLAVWLVVAGAIILSIISLV